ncbi:MAG TPA: carboxypeptidase-like regulatory domain-containing protein [Acidobacteriaceae bacterium]|nr:carboxypeptidase-like regulatory domain-containing protein [Acidobacteriaceae bacterium]
MGRAGQIGNARTAAGILRLLLVCLFCCGSVSAQTQPPQQALPAAAPGQPDGQVSGSIGGTVVDQNGDVILSTRVRLTREGAQQVTPDQETAPDQEGRFFFPGVLPGPFELTISGRGFATQVRPGVLHAGEALQIPVIVLAIAAATSEVQVSVSKEELAEEQVKLEEQQRVLGFIPNFYVSYDHDAPSLSARQKFELAWRTSADPISFLAAGAIAGVEQAANALPGYGQGAPGYGKRFGASYGDIFIGTMIGNAILPSLLRQDPRYFYKGTGSTRSRILYALENAVVCRGDNGRQQVNYSSILGSLAAGGISNLYYPASSRNGATLTFENSLIGIASSGVADLFQEFLVRKLTPHAQAPRTGKP